MAKNIDSGDTVYITYPRFDLKILERPRPFFEKIVSLKKDRSINIALPHGKESDFIRTSIIHKNTGILIIRIGDFLTENTLLNPLSKTVLQFSRLLLGDDSFVHFEKCRKWGSYTHTNNFFRNN